MRNKKINPDRLARKITDIARRMQELAQALRDLEAPGLEKRPRRSPLGHILPTRSQPWVCAVGALLLAGLSVAGPLMALDEGAAAVADIRLSFKLDPRLASGVYGGERWVSPATYRGTNAQDTVEVKATAVDSKGNPIAAAPTWIPSDPEMVAVSPGQGERVKIAVKRAGQSSLKVTSGGVTKELAIKAETKNNILQMEIVQPVPEQIAPAPKSESKPSEEEDSSALKGPKAKLSYALGVNLGKGIEKQSIEVDGDLVVQGLKDALSGKEMLLTEHEVAVIISGLQAQLKAKQVTHAAEKIVAAKEAAEKNKKDGETFLAENKTKEGVVTLESGLQYKVLKAGDGKKPSAEDSVVCHYRGTLLDGKEFDSSFRRNEPAAFPLKRVIKGWNQALQLMPVGSKWQLFVPPHLAYGARGANSGIPPNATLIFEVELLSIKDPAVASTEAPTRPPGPSNSLVRPRRAR